MDAPHNSNKHSRPCMNSWRRQGITIFAAVAPFLTSVKKRRRGKDYTSRRISVISDTISIKRDRQFVQEIPDYYLHYWSDQVREYRLFARRLKFVTESVESTFGKGMARNSPRRKCSSIHQFHERIFSCDGLISRLFSLLLRWDERGYSSKSLSLKLGIHHSEIGIVQF